MRAAGIAGALNCPIATKPEQVESINRWSTGQHRWPMLSLGTIHPDTPGPERVLAGVRAAGLPGIKLHPEYQSFHLDDPRLTPIWQACAELGLIVLMHCGADIAFDPPYHSTPASIAALLDQHPNLTLVAAHFGGWKMWDAVARDLVGRRFFMDVSFTDGYMSDSEVVALSRRHGVERVLFGSDAPWRDQAADLRAFERLGFTAAERRRILWDNAAALFGLDAHAG